MVAHVFLLAVEPFATVGVVVAAPASGSLMLLLLRKLIN